MKERLTPASTLPGDHARAALIGRVWAPDVGGPVVVHVHRETLYDLSPIAPTSSELLNLDNPIAAIRGASNLRPIGTLEEVLANTTPESRNNRAPWLLAVYVGVGLCALAVGWVEDLAARRRPMLLPA